MIQSYSLHSLSVANVAQDDPHKMSQSNVAERVGRVNRELLDCLNLWHEFGELHLIM